MKYGEFKTLVDSFINKRGLSTRIPQFIEMAKLELLRKHDFAFTRTVGTVSYPSTENTGVALPSDFKALVGGHGVKLVLSSGELILEATNYEREKARQHRTTSVSYNSDQIATQMSEVTSRDVAPIRYYLIPGANVPTLFTLPEQLSATLYVEYYKWLPQYTSEVEEDFLLLRGYDLLLYETLKVANTYIFEEDRIPLDATVAAAKLELFIELDGALDRSNAPINVS